MAQIASMSNCLELMQGAKIMNECNFGAEDTSDVQAGKLG